MTVWMEASVQTLLADCSHSHEADLVDAHEVRRESTEERRRLEQRPQRLPERRVAGKHVEVQVKRQHEGQGRSGGCWSGSCKR